AYRPEVGVLFVARYITALIGIYIALITPASVTLAIRVGQIDPQGKASSLALVASIGAAAALFSNPIFGMLSDRSTSRWGQRRVFIFWGFLVGVLSIFAIGAAPTIPLVALGWAVAQVAFNAAIAATIAVLPERVPTKLRGRVSGFMGMTGQLAVVSGVFLIQLVGTKGVGMFIWPAILGCALVLPFLLTLKEVRRHPGEVPNLTLKSVFGALWINPFQHRDFGLVWAGRFLAWTALYLLTTYKTYFLIDRLGYSTETVAPILTTAMFVLAVAVAVSTDRGWRACSPTIWGVVSRWSLSPRSSSSIAMLVVAFANDVESFLIGMAIPGLGNGLYFRRRLCPSFRGVIPDRESSAGKSMGVFNLSSTIPQTIAPCDRPGFFCQHQLEIEPRVGKLSFESPLYLFAAAFALLSALFIQFIKGAK
ncbi:MFS transporter, partial [Rhizobium nepotum]|uniref:MFS transporter n=1 Tax=Rhizobium nepotum TaxID=1035271 RepID=UPI003CF4BA8F